MKKKCVVCAILLWAFLLCWGQPIFAAEETDGSCGADVRWSFDQATHTLTISGTGAMEKPAHQYDTRWTRFYPIMYYIVIEEGVTSICESAFAGSYALKEITIPQTVTSIGRAALRESGLAQIDLHDGITKIDINAFESSKLKEITIPAGVTELSAGLFRDCDQLETINLHNGITTIHGNAFARCDALQSIVIPDSVTVLSGAFMDCVSLKEVTLSRNITEIVNHCFQQCVSLETIHLPDKIESIGLSAFKGCTSLKSVTIGSGLKTINSSAFGDCENLAQIEISDKNPWLFSDENGAVYNKDQTSLMLLPPGFKGEYTVLEGTRTIEPRAAQGCSGLIKLTLPKSVTLIKSGAFEDCKALKYVDLGQVQVIEAFGRCDALQILTIPASVTWLQTAAFSACGNLKAVEFLGSYPMLGAGVFSISYNGEAWYPEGYSAWESYIPQDEYFRSWHIGCAGAHSFVDTENVPATCTKTGKTTGRICSVCEFPEVLPEEIPMLEHRFGFWSYITPAGTPLREREVHRLCEDCGFEQREYAYNVDASVLPEAPTVAPKPTEPIPGQEEPAKMDAVIVVILVIVVVAACFIGVEIYLARKKKKAE